MTANARIRKSAGGTSGSRRRTMRMGNAIAAAMPMPSAMKARRVGPLLLLATDEPEADAADRDRDDRRAQPVEPSRRVRVERLRHVAHGRVQGQQHQRHVDQEREAPRERVDDDAADEGTHDGQRGGGGGPQPERAGTRLALEVGRDERQRSGHQQRARGTLEQPEDDEPLHRRRQAAQRGREPERREPDDEDPATAVPVGQGARDDEERGQHREVAAGDVRLALERADLGGGQVERRWSAGRR